MYERRCAMTRQKRILKFYCVVITLVCILTAGCRETITEVVLIDPSDLWRSKNFHNYTMEQTRICFCFDGGEKMVVTVLADTVHSVVRSRDSAYIAPPSSRYYLTVDSLFGIIKYSQADSIEVTYDANFGYPARIDIDPQLNPVDGGVTYITNSVNPILGTNR